MVKPTPTQPSRSASSTRGGHRLVADVAAGQAVGAVQLEDQRHLAGIGDRTDLERPERCGVGREPRLDRELEQIARVVGRGIGREAAGRAVLEALVDRQDHHLAGAARAGRA